MSDKQPAMVDAANTDQARAWDGDAGMFWADHADRFDRSVSRYQQRLMNAAGITDDSAVLDIGCGAGQTSCDAARLAASGSVLGVDLSSQMLQVARQRADLEGISNVRFEQADAQVYPFAESSFDVAVSRSGAMFFGDPVAAFGNMTGALRPGGRLVLLVWQDLSRNEWVREISRAFSAGRDVPRPAPDAPGPLSLSDPDRVRRLLIGAGLSEPSFEDLAEPMFFGSEPEDAFDFIVGLSGWMLEDLDSGARANALDALRSALAAHHTDEGVAFASAVWLITAQKL